MIVYISTYLQVLWTKQCIFPIVLHRSRKVSPLQVNELKTSKVHSFIMGYETKEILSTKWIKWYCNLSTLRTFFFNISFHANIEMATYNSWLWLLNNDLFKTDCHHHEKVEANGIFLYLMETPFLSLPRTWMVQMFWFYLKWSFCISNSFSLSEKCNVENFGLIQLDLESNQHFFTSSISKQQSFSSFSHRYCCISL